MHSRAGGLKEEERPYGGTLERENREGKQGSGESIIENETHHKT
jgi:hypothetical protein